MIDQAYEALVAPVVRMFKRLPKEIAEAEKALAEARVAAAASRKAYEAAVAATRALKEREAELDAVLRFGTTSGPRFELLELRGRAAIEGTTPDPKRERELALQVDRMADALAYLRETALVEANRVDTRAIGAAQDHEARVSQLEGTIENLKALQQAEIDSPVAHYYATPPEHR